MSEQLKIVPLVIEGIVTSQRPWKGKGRVATVEADGGPYTVGFSHDLRVPKEGVRFRLEAMLGKEWLFARKWEYLAVPVGKTPDGFPVKGDAYLERLAWDIIKSLSEFTVDDLHSMEDDIAMQGRDRRVLGSILRRFKNRELIKEVRTVHSKRKECHNRPVVLWTRIVDLDVDETGSKKLMGENIGP
jgi:hypothetical protein